MDYQRFKHLKTGNSEVKFPMLNIIKKHENILEEEMDIYTFMKKEQNNPKTKMNFISIDSLKETIVKNEQKRIVEKDLEELKIWNVLKEKGISVEWSKKAKDVGIDIVT